MGENFDNKLFYHVSTDEVYGSLGETGLFEETTLRSKSPYSASKAAQIILLEHMVKHMVSLYYFKLFQ